ncbi:PrpR N-terminal domain-containing protein [Terribacillus saccharophilus]|uniref:sigma-54-dependent transcriptional regulator n=1 Tax=Terribacillus saccharophilus TaxID=361277 RepID=UPI00380F55C7
MKITAIAPYAGLGELIQDVANQKELGNIDIVQGDLQHGVNIAIEAEKQGTDIIISRGGTAERIKQHVTIPVINIEVSGFDLLRIITLIKDTDNRVAFVGFPAIANAVSSVSQLIDVNLDIYAIDDEHHIENQLRLLKEENYTFVIGDVITVQLAEKIGMHGLLLTSGKESVLSAFRQAEETYRTVEEIKQERETYAQILQDLNQHTIIADKYLQLRSLSTPPIPLPTPFIRRIAAAVFQFDQILVEVVYKNRFYRLNAHQLGSQQVVIELLEQEAPSKSLPSISLVADPNASVYLSSNHEEVQLAIEQAEALREQLTPLVIIGENGTGKESLARYIHTSDTAAFLRIDGAAFPIALLPYLAIVLEDGGTLYIVNADKIEETTKEWVEKQLKVKIPFRIILAMNNKTSDRIPTKFKTLHLPPLRERKEDIPNLIRLFISSFNSEYGMQIAGISEDAIQLLESNPFESNIIELSRIINKAVRKEETAYIQDTTIANIIDELQDQSKTVIDITGSLADIETQIIQAVWLEEKKNNSKTAERLGINRTTLWRKLKEIQ